jgi:hypothetical protein
MTPGSPDGLMRAIFFNMVRARCSPAVDRDRFSSSVARNLPEQLPRYVLRTCGTLQITLAEMVLKMKMMR